MRTLYPQEKDSFELAYCLEAASWKIEKRLQEAKKVLDAFREHLRTHQLSSQNVGFLLFREMELRAEDDATLYAFLLMLTREVSILENQIQLLQKQPNKS